MKLVTMTIAAIALLMATNSNAEIKVGELEVECMSGNTTVFSRRKVDSVEFTQAGRTIVIKHKDRYRFSAAVACVAHDIVM